MGTIDKSLDRLHSALFDYSDPLTAAWIDIHKTGSNYHLLRENTCREHLKQPVVHLVSAVDMEPEALEESGIILTGIGCLGGVVYTVPAYPSTTPDVYDLHNFGTHVMDFRKGDTLTPYLFTLKGALRTAPINYLAMGSLFESLRTEKPLAAISQSMSLEEHVTTISAAFTNLHQETLQRFREKRFFDTAAIKDALSFVDQVVGCTHAFPSLSYFYFEAISFVLMVYSKPINGMRTGEFNNRLYIDLVNRYHALATTTRFGSYSFRPSRTQLETLLDESLFTPIFNMNDFFVAAANALVLFISSSLNDLSDVSGMAYYDFCVKNDLAPMLEAQVANSMHSYWKQANISLVYNSTIEKGEVGITPVAEPYLRQIHACRYNKKKTSVTRMRQIKVTVQRHTKEQKP